MSNIKGYRELSDLEIQSINDIKQTAEQLEELIAWVTDRGDADPRWIAIAKTDLQKGFMALTRAIAKPESF